MPWLIFAGVFLVWIFSLIQPQKEMTLTDTINDAIRKGIVSPLGLPAVAVDILRVQSKLETGSWTSKAFKATNSLFNRHAGSGRGVWIGAEKPRSSWKIGVDLYYAKPGDEDLRVYTDVYQSARDMAQLLKDPLYVQALRALERGSMPDYYNALKTAGFAADPSYAQSLAKLYTSEIA